MGRIFGCGPSLYTHPFYTLGSTRELIVTELPITPSVVSHRLPAGVTLREATASDIPQMIDMVNAAFEEEAFLVNAPRTHAAQLAEHFRSGHFLLAHRGAQLIASVYYEVRGDRGYIGMLAVSPDHQRTGLGRAMMRTAEGVLRAAGCSFAELTVIDLRTKLLQAYLRLGYREAGKVDVPEELRRKLTVPVELIKLEKPL